MNIFLVKPEEYDDKRLNKQILELCQMLCTARPGPYKPTHVNHPVTKWVGKNFEWSHNFLGKLLVEYTYRFYRIHLCTRIYDFFDWGLDVSPTEWCNCTPYPDLEVHEAYRRLLNDKWNAGNPKWTNRNEPEWRVKI